MDHPLLLQGGYESWVKVHNNKVEAYRFSNNKPYDKFRVTLGCDSEGISEHHGNPKGTCTYINYSFSFSFLLGNVGKHQCSFYFQTYKNRRIFSWPNALGSSPSEDTSKYT